MLTSAICTDRLPSHVGDDQSHACVMSHVQDPFRASLTPYNEYRTEETNVKRLVSDFSGESLQLQITRDTHLSDSNKDQILSVGYTTNADETCTDGKNFNNGLCNVSRLSGVGSNSSAYVDVVPPLRSVISRELPNRPFARRQHSQTNILMPQEKENLYQDLQGVQNTKPKTHRQAEAGRGTDVGRLRQCSVNTCSDIHQSHKVSTLKRYILAIVVFNIISIAACIGFVVYFVDLRSISDPVPLALPLSRTAPFCMDCDVLQDLTSSGWDQTLQTEEGGQCCLDSMETLVDIIKKISKNEVNDIRKVYRKPVMITKGRNQGDSLVWDVIKKQGSIDLSPDNTNFTIEQHGYYQIFSHFRLKREAKIVLLDYAIERYENCKNSSEIIESVGEYRNLTGRQRYSITFQGVVHLRKDDCVKMVISPDTLPDVDMSRAYRPKFNIFTVD